MTLVLIAQALLLLIIILLFSLRYPTFRLYSRLINRSSLVMFLSYLALITAGLAEVGATEEAPWPVSRATYLTSPRCIA